MKRFAYITMACVFSMSAVAADNNARGRRTMSAQMMPAPRVTASVNQLSVPSPEISISTTPSTTTSATVSKPSVRVENEHNVEPAPRDVDTREKEKNICLSNNIGVGNTFVWASRYSNIGDYAAMTEDVENPENNTCWVRVELKSSDSKINLADIAGRYFEFGRTVTCGEWANEETLKKRILDAKKSARTWGTVAGAVGGAAVGVGAMELFGNKLIGGSVQGQKALSGTELLNSQLAVLKKDSESDYKRFVSLMGDLWACCEDGAWKTASASKPSACDTYDFASIKGVTKSAKCIN